MPTALKALPTPYRNPSSLYVLLAHAEKAVAAGASATIEDYIEAFNGKSDQDKKLEVDRFKSRAPRADLDSASHLIANNGAKVKSLDGISHFKSEQEIEKSLADFRNLYDVRARIMRLNGETKRRDGHIGLSTFRQICFPPLPAQSVLAKEIESPTLSGTLAAVDVFMGHHNLDPYVFLNASKGYKAMTSLLKVLYDNQEGSNGYVVHMLTQYRASHFPLPIDEAMKGDGSGASTAFSKDEGDRNRVIKSILALVPIFNGISDKDFLEAGMDKQFRLVENFIGKANDKAASQRKTYLGKLMSMPGIVAYRARLATKAEPADMRPAEDRAALEFQEHEASEVHTTWNVFRSVPIVDAGDEETGIWSLEKLPTLHQKEPYQFRGDHNKRWPWGDVNHFGRVHPAFSDPAEPTRCDSRVEIGKATVKGIDYLHKLYRNELPHINSALVQSGVDARPPKMMQSSEFKRVIEAEIKRYLEAVRNNDVPDCYANQRVARLARENCDSEEEADALVGDGENPQYGVLLDDYAIEAQPLAAYGNIVGIFSGLDLDEKGRETYLATLGKTLGEQYLASDGIANMRANTDKNTLATLGFGNQMRCINTGVDMQVSGIVRSDLHKCNVIFAPAEVGLRDRDGNPYRMKLVFGLQIRPVGPGKQLKAYYGSAYRLDQSGTGVASEAEVRIKDEPEDPPTLS